MNIDGILREISLRHHESIESAIRTNRRKKRYVIFNGVEYEPVSFDTYEQALAFCGDPSQIDEVDA